MALGWDLMRQLNGKRALVTGASSGLGAHFAQTLAAAGAEVILAARRLEALQENVSRINAVGGKARMVPLDVANPSSIADLALQIDGLDILVNNAGVVV